MTNTPRSYPPELDRQPRVVNWRTSGDFTTVIVLRLIAPLLVAIAAIMIVGSVAWALYGTDQQGRVTGTSISHGKHTSYRVHYTYMLGDAEREDTSNVTFNEYNRLTGLLAQPESSNQPPLIRVRVLKAGPWTGVDAIGSDETVWQVPTLSWVFGGMLVFFAVILGYTGYVLPWRERRLYDEGLPAPAVITNKEAIRGKGTSYYLHYTFTQLDGQERRAKMVVNRTRWDQAAEGEEVTVLYYEGGRFNRIYQYGRYVCA